MNSRSPAPSAVKDEQIDSLISRLRNLVTEFKTVVGTIEQLLDDPRAVQEPKVRHEHSG